MPDRSRADDDLLDARRLEVERSMREIVATSEIPPYDHVEHGSLSVTFLWDEPRLAVIVDLDDDLPAAPQD